MKIEISLGELVDKVTILSIKSSKIVNEAKLKNINRELALLQQAMVTAGISQQDELYQRLQTVNNELWEIEDQIRLKEAKKEFDEGFIRLARSVYFHNDDRAAIKREINLRFGSELVEEKEYAAY